MRRTILTAIVLAFAGTTLGACFDPFDPAHDPHNLPYQVWPGNSPGVYQYSTNLYAAPDAPPIGGPGLGGSRN